MSRLITPTLRLRGEKILVSFRAKDVSLFRFPKPTKLKSPMALAMNMAAITHMPSWAYVRSIQGSKIVRFPKVTAAKSKRPTATTIVEKIPDLKINWPSGLDGSTDRLP